MTITERVAYIRGLLEGMEINVDKKEGRILKEMLELLEDMALSVTDLEDENDAMQDVLDAMIEDIYDDDDSHDGDDEEDELDFDPDSDMYEVVCPSCGEEIYVDEATLAQGAIKCPACGDELEFDMSALEDEDDAVIGVDAEPVSEDEDEFDDD